MKNAAKATNQSWEEEEEEEEDINRLKGKAPPVYTYQSFLTSFEELIF